MEKILLLPDDAIPKANTLYCRRRQTEDGTQLDFRQEKRLLPRIRLIDSFISGGSFREYLMAEVSGSKEPICLYLRRGAAGFRLPCTDGQGTELTERFTGGKFSRLTCENYLWREQDEYDLILYDDEASLREKAAIAEQCGVAYLLLDSDM
ncbi:MAG: hypothetical protein IJS31_07300 [Oscillospiraceae bacterium]|nr:hypothetical protein [Oscillospiraceae bacterium]